MKRLLLIAAVAAFPLFAAPAFAAQCVNVNFFDKRGVPLPTGKPVVGMMVGDRLLFTADVPTDATYKAGAEAACPTTVVTEVRDTFQSACLSEARRNQASAEHHVDRKTIDQSCSDMLKALGPDAIAPAN